MVKLADTTGLKSVSEKSEGSSPSGSTNLKQAYYQRLDNKRKEFLNKILTSSFYPIKSYKLKALLFKYNIKENKCEECGISDWNGKKLNCELEHIDGIPTHNKLENLKILCPNCHSQTKSFRFRDRHHSEQTKKQISNKLTGRKVNNRYGT